MDHIDRCLATATRDDHYKPCIQAAVAMGKKLLNKYYSYTDHLELYCIAMSKCLLVSTLFVMLIQFHPGSSSPKSQACVFRSGRVAR